MTNVRKPAMAGWFYPADAVELRAQVTGLLAAAPTGGTVPKAIIAPHAGYVYSGPVAATAYARLAAARGRVTRVVLVGPAHQVAFRGAAAPTVDYFASPLGCVAVDRDALRQIAALSGVHERDAAHETEHSLEVHLPFLQTVLGEFAVVPLLAGDAAAGEIGDVLDALWGGPETLVVISSDLSHYHDYDAAQLRDRATTRAIEALRYEDIDYDAACGRVPISGLLHVARRRGLSVRNLDLRNSGDTAGDRARVVGYGAYAVE